jgi:hypothetical protein
MGIGGASLRAVTGFALVASMAALVTESSSAAPPPGPSYACTTAAKPTGSNPLKIMLAGDSITSGSSGDYTWRYWLWQNLAGHGASVDFVGRFDDIIDSVTQARGGKQYADCNFDQDEEARGGGRLYSADPKRPSYDRPFTSPDSTQPNYPGYSSWIRGAVATYKPAVMVANVGALDLAFATTPGTDAQVAAEAIKFLKTFINEARLGNPGVDIVITTAPTYTSGTTRASRYNAMLPGVVSSKTTAASRLTIAKLPSWSNHTWDGAHPDAIGEVSIAAVVTDALHKLFPSLPAKPATLQKPHIGPRRPAVITSAQTAGNNKVTLDWTLPPGGDRTIIYSRNVTGNGPWVQQGDLVMSSLKKYYPKVGTAECGTTPCTTFTVGGLSGGTTYAFAVRAAKGLSVASDLLSNIESVKATGPLGKVAPTTAPGARSVTVSWPNLGGTSGYDVRWRKAGASSWAGTTTAKSSPRVISGLVAGQKYGFEVRAKSGGLLASTGPWSDEVFGVPKAS